jgi:hypothetical protein
MTLALSFVCIEALYDSVVPVIRIAKVSSLWPLRALQLFELGDKPSEQMH